MKKFYVLSLMAAAGLGASAQSLDLSQPSFEKVSLLERECATVFSTKSSPSKAPRASWALMSTPAYGAYFAGVDADLKNMKASMVLNGMNQRSLIAFAYGGTNGARPESLSWYYTDPTGARVDLPTDDKGNAILKNFGMIDYPIVEGYYNGEKAVYNKNYDSNNKASENKVFNMFNKELTITMPDISYVGAFYGGFESGSHFGKGMPDKNGEELKGVFSLFNKTTTPMAVHGAIVPLATIEEGDQAYIGANGLTLEIWRLEDGMVFAEKLGSATAPSEQIYGVDGKPGFYSMTFEFFGEGPFAGPEPVIIGADQSFAVVVKGLEDANLSVMFSLAMGMEGTGYILYGDGYENIGTIGYEDMPEIPQTNLAISLIADVHSAMWQDPVMNCPVEGGLAKVDDSQDYAVVYTSTLIDSGDEKTQYVVNAPDWLTVGELKVLQSDEGGWEKTRAYTLELTAASLPDGESGRSGVVTITAPYTGLTDTFQIGQGEWTPSGVESVEVAKANVAVVGDNFQLTYGEEFNKVTVYNVAGSVVASYALPQGGSFEVPAADLNGVYVLVFEGASNEVVKVVK